MKICYLANAASIHTARWVNYLARRGHQMHILSFEDASDLDPAVTVHPLGKTLPYKMHYLLTSNKVRRLLHSLQPDIVHAHYASGYATLARLAGFHPYVLSVWGSDIFDFPRKSALHRRIVIDNLKEADRLCSTSRIMADEIQRFCAGQSKIFVTPFGVDCQRFRPLGPGSNNGRPFVIGIVKALEPNYGIEDLIKGFSILSHRVANPDILHLTIVGKGSLLRSLRALAGDLGIARQTTFAGFVPHEDVPGVLNQFSVFVAPSVNFESFGVAVIEASACGLPVVVTHVGGLPEVVRDRVTGIVVPPRDPNAIAEALKELFENEQLRAELGAKGRNFVLANYEWSENASRMERIYRSCLPDVASSSRSHLIKDESLEIH